MIYPSLVDVGCLAHRPLLINALGGSRSDQFVWEHRSKGVQPASAPNEQCGYRHSCAAISLPQLKTRWSIVTSSCGRNGFCKKPAIPLPANRTVASCSL